MFIRCCYVADFLGIRESNFKCFFFAWTQEGYSISMFTVARIFCVIDLLKSMLMLIADAITMALLACEHAFVLFFVPSLFGQLQQAPLTNWLLMDLQPLFFLPNHTHQEFKFHEKSLLDFIFWIPWILSQIFPFNYELNCDDYMSCSKFIILGKLSYLDGIFDDFWSLHSKPGATRFLHSDCGKL